MERASYKGWEYLWCLLIVVPGGLAADFTGEVIRVLDGDTIEVLHEKKPERIRLYGIDCPEKGQPFGQKAKQATSALVFSKESRFRRTERINMAGPLPMCCYHMARASMSC
jgi:endonuclease YncB( thermonuclease family)